MIKIFFRSFDTRIKRNYQNFDCILKLKKKSMLHLFKHIDNKLVYYENNKPIVIGILFYSPELSLSEFWFFD